jgi:hypothetical protein
MSVFDGGTTRRQPLPYVIDNQQHRLSDTLTELLAQSVGKPLDIATAYFAISGYRLVKGDDATLVREVGVLAEEFGKQKPKEKAIKRLGREDLELICFEYVSA